MKKKNKNLLIHYFNILPEEIIYFEILTYLDGKDIFSLNLVSKFFVKYTSSQKLWKELCFIENKNLFSYSEEELEGYQKKVHYWKRVYFTFLKYHFDPLKSSGELNFDKNLKRAVKDDRKNLKRHAGINVVIKTGMILKLSFFVFCEKGSMAGMTVGIIDVLNHPPIDSVQYVGKSKYSFSLGCYNKWPDGMHTITGDKGVSCLQTKENVLSSGDILTMIIDMKKGELRYQVKEKFDFVAFKELKGKYRPMVSFTSGGCFQAIEIVSNFFDEKTKQQLSDEILEFMTLNRKELPNTLTKKRVKRVRNLK